MRVNNSPGSFLPEFRYVSTCLVSNSMHESLVPRLNLDRNIRRVVRTWAILIN
jgi:hypothetical protein